jgi:hypothetical protein
MSTLSYKYGTGVSSVGTDQLRVANNSSEKGGSAERNVKKIGFEELVLQFIVGPAQGEDVVVTAFLRHVRLEAVND